MWALPVIAALGGVVLGVAIAAVLLRRSSRPTPTVPASGTPRPAPSQSLSAQVVEALADGVIVVDREERAILVNPAARQMGVLSADRLAFPELSALVRRVFDDGLDVQATVDLPIGRLGREPIGLSVSAVGLPAADDRVGQVALLLGDMTELRRLESVRRDFVANVSHELKTPVGALTLLAEAIQDASDDPEAVARFAARMQREGNRLSRLVRELIDLSRVQGADPMPGASTIPVETIVDEAVDRARLAAEQSNIDLVARTEPGLMVRGNVAQLTMAMTNLIDNAIAYSAIDSRVVVAAVAAEDEDARPSVDLVVTDQGIGISDQDLERIFERFYRVDPARSRATGGTGLGLALVKNVVTNHRGQVIVRSVEGSGSSFTIRLPRVHFDGPQSPAGSVITTHDVRQG